MDIFEPRLSPNKKRTDAASSLRIHSYLSSKTFHAKWENRSSGGRNRSPKPAIGSGRMSTSTPARIRRFGQSSGVSARCRVTQFRLTHDTLQALPIGVAKFMQNVSTFASQKAAANYFNFCIRTPMRRELCAFGFPFSPPFRFQCECGLCIGAGINSSLSNDGLLRRRALVHRFPSQSNKINETAAATSKCAVASEKITEGVRTQRGVHFANSNNRRARVSACVWSCANERKLNLSITRRSTWSAVDDSTRRRRWRVRHGFACTQNVVLSRCERPIRRVATKLQISTATVRSLSVATRSQSKCARAANGQERLHASQPNAHWTRFASRWLLRHDSNSRRYCERQHRAIHAPSIKSRAIENKTNRKTKPNFKAIL